MCAYIPLLHKKRPLTKNKLEILKQYKKNSARTKARQSVYSTQGWKKLSKDMLTEQPTCIRCWERYGTVTPSQHTHHIKTFLQKDGSVNWDLVYDKNNLCCLCSSCHSQIHFNKQMGLLEEEDEKYIQ